MALSSGDNLLVFVIFLGVSFYMFFLLEVRQPNQVSYYETMTTVENQESLNGHTVTIMNDDTIAHNISERILENVRGNTSRCITLRESVTLPVIYIITPTYKRPEQIPDLTRLAQTLMHVPSIMWLVIEDAKTLNPEVAKLLRRTGIKFLHMLAPMPKEHQKREVKPRGVSNRNKGLQWIRENFVDTRGVVYFADDDNTYDIRLFNEIRSVKSVGMWPVGLVTDFGVSSPVVRNGRVVGFYDGWVGNRRFPLDMAGFAVSVNMILKNPKGTMPFAPGYEEDGFLRNLNVTINDIEPKAEQCTKIYVWHTQTKKNKSPTKINATVYGHTNIWKLYQQII